MELKLDRKDLKPQFENMAISLTNFHHFKPEVQAAIKSVGEAYIHDFGSYNRILKPSHTVILNPDTLVVLSRSRRTIMEITLIACNKDGSQGFQETVHFEDKEEFLEAYKEFEESVPFSRWYLDLDGEDETQELVDEWLD